MTAHLSRERLEEIRYCNWMDDLGLSMAEVNEMARRLLEGMSSEPVAWQYRVSAGHATGWSLWHEGKGEQYEKSYQVERRALYAAPPAPVAVPDDNGLLPCPFCGGKAEEDSGGVAEFHGHEHQDLWITCQNCGAEITCNGYSDVPCSCHHDIRKNARDRWNRRAAMQSFGNSEQLASPHYTFPGGWIKCSEQMPEDMATVIVASGKDISHMWWNGNRWDCWNKNDAIDDVTHWMPLPATPDHPEQEV